MKKFFIALSIITLFLLILLSIYNFSNHSKDKKVSNTPSIATKEDISSSSESASISEPSTIDEPIIKAETPIYNILGTAQKPTVYPNTAMKQWRESSVSLASNYRGSLFINGPSDKNTVALTFDDGPDGVNTPKILKILKDNNVHATFFCIGSYIQRNRTTVLNAFNDGNVIASHSWSHKDFTKLSRASMDEEMSKTEQQIYDVIGKKPAFVRPPYGAVNATVQDALIADGYKSVLWSIDTLDWAQKDVNNIVNNVMSNIRPGEIILMHCDGDKATTAEALPIIIQKLKALDYSFVTVDEMAAAPAYK